MIENKQSRVEEESKDIITILKDAIKNETKVILTFPDKKYIATIRYVDQEDASFGFIDVDGKPGSSSLGGHRGLINVEVSPEQ